MYLHLSVHTNDTQPCQHIKKVVGLQFVLNTTWDWLLNDVLNIVHYHVLWKQRIANLRQIRLTIQRSSDPIGSVWSVMNGYSEMIVLNWKQGKRKKDASTDSWVFGLFFSVEIISYPRLIQTFWMAVECSWWWVSHVFRLALLTLRLIHFHWVIDSCSQVSLKYVVAWKYGLLPFPVCVIVYII